MVEYYLVLKRNEPSSHQQMWKNPKCILLSERSPPEKFFYSDYMMFWKRQNCGYSEKIRGWREGGMNRWSTGDFYNDG